jgi:hypothetical protein
MIVFDPAAGVTHLQAAAGGCRIPARPPEWTVSFPAVYFAARHFYPRGRYWVETFALNVRRYVLRKDNVLRPWRLPWAGLSYIYAVMKALGDSAARKASLRQLSREPR